MHRNWRYKFSFDKLSVLQLSWWVMGWESVIVALVGALNIAYSLYYVQFLPDFNKFLLFMAAYGILSLLLTIASSVISLRISLHYQRLMGLRLDDASDHINLRFYTIGDISTRVSDAGTVISAM